MNVTDAVDFIVAHRMNKVFKAADGWTKDRIALRLAQAIKERAFAYSLDAEGKLTGVCVAKPNHSNRELHIAHLLTAKPGAVREILKWYHKLYDGWRMKAQRRGKIVYYDTPRLVHKLEALS